MSAVDLTNFFLINDVKEDHIVHANGEISVGFLLNHLPLGITGPETKKNIYDYVNRLLRDWKPGIWMQKQDFFWERMVKPENERHYSEISIENYKYYSMRHTLGHVSFLYVTYTPEEFRNINLTDSSFIRLVKQMKAPSQKRIDDEVNAFMMSLREDIKKGTTGFKGKLLTASQWEKVFYAYYSGNYNFENWETPEVLDLGSFSNTNEGYLQRENVLFGNVYMGKEPQEGILLWDKWKVEAGKEEKNFVYNPNEELDNYAAFPITAGLPFSHCTTVTIQKAENQKVINEINNQMKLNSFGVNSQGKSLDDVNAETKQTTQNHAEILKKYITDSPYPACSYGVTVTIPSHDTKTLSQKVEMAKSAFSQYAAKGEFHKSQNMPTYFASAPAHGHNGHDMLIGQTVNALPFFNINSLKRESKSGILFIDPTTGYPMNIEPWDNPLLAGVRNGTVSGPTRGGKGVTIANEVDYYCSDPIYHQIMVEKGQSYKWLTEIYDGEYVDLNPESEIGIDLFEYDPKKVSEMQKSLIISVMSKIYPQWDEKVLAGVTNIFENYNSELKDSGRQPNIEEFYAYFTEEYMESETVYSQHMDFGLYASELKRFVHGANKWLFNNKNSVRINDKPFVVFELKALESSPLFNLATEAILGLINRKMEYWDRKIRIAIKIDEALQAFENEHSSHLLKEFYTQVGKFNAGISIMVQSIGLIQKLPAWAAVDANTQMRYYTYNRHLDGWAEKEAKLQGWSNHRLKLLKNLRDTSRWREHLLIMGEEEFIVGVELSPIANYVFSTAPEVRNKVLKLREDNPNRSLKELIFEQYYRNKKKGI